MSDIAPEIKVVLTAEDQGVAAAVRQLGDELKNLKTHEATAASGAITLRDAFRSLVGALSLYSAINFGKKILDDGVAIGNLARIIGVSSSTVSVFKHVSEETGVSWERIGRSLAMGARRITEFLGGEAQAAEGMKLLGLTAKDFGGLNADQKLSLMVQALGRLPDGFNKAAAAQILFSRGGRDMVVVANAIARQGFGAIEDELRRMGVLMDDDFTNKAAVAQASLHTTEDLARGLAVEFESGLLPAISDVGEGLLKTYASTDQASNGFVLLGMGAGATIKLLIVGFNEVWEIVKSGGDVVELVGGIIVDTFETAAAAIVAAADAANGEFVKAINDIRFAGEEWRNDFARFGAQIAENNRANKELTENLFPDASKAKSFHDALFGTPEGNKKRAEEMIHELALDQARAGAEKVPSLLTGRGARGESAPPEAAARAQLALQLKQAQDALSIDKAMAEQRAAVEKGEYERGLVSIAQYYTDRRAAIAEGTRKEIATITAERDQVQAAANLAGERAISARSDMRAASTPAERQRLAAEADRYAAEQLTNLARVDELNTRISEQEIASRTQIAEMDNAQFRAEAEQKQKLLEMEKRIALASETDLRNKQQATDQAQRQLEIDRDAITASDGSQTARERAYLSLLRQEMPLLEQKARAELLAAQASGDTQAIQRAQQTLQQIRQLDVAITELGNHWKQTLNVSMTNSFQGIVTALTNGSRDIGQNFQQMEVSVIRSLEAIAVQMLANALTQKALAEGTKLDDAKTAAANVYAQVSAIPVIGWILAPAAAAAAFATVLAFAEGGPVSGERGVDRVPAMLTHGEYVINADAARSFGASNLDAINARKFDFAAAVPHEMASLHDFSRPSFELPASLGASAHVHNVRSEIHLHHNGPDALEVLRAQLVPELKMAIRAGALEGIET
ncbi:MAG TPA: hypothetical protein VKS20_10980 [Candidatus Acidoferrales bacterium]|nr:hypothetical protein [Candidatus Acidoferrales bacterium]